MVRNYQLQTIINKQVEILQKWFFQPWTSALTYLFSPKTVRVVLTLSCGTDVTDLRVSAPMRMLTDALLLWFVKTATWPSQVRMRNFPACFHLLLICRWYRSSGFHACQTSQKGDTIFRKLYYFRQPIVFTH